MKSLPRPILQHHEPELCNIRDDAPEIGGVGADVFLPRLASGFIRTRACDRRPDRNAESATSNVCRVGEAEADARELTPEEDRALRAAFGRFAAPSTRAAGTVVA